MTAHVFLTLLQIQVIVVALVDCSGFMDWAKGKLARWLGIRGEISLKPFDCSLCMTHWTGLVWLIASGNISLTAYMVLLGLALSATVTRRAVAFVIFVLQKIFDYGEEIINN